MGPLPPTTSDALDRLISGCEAARERIASLETDVKAANEATGEAEANLRAARDRASTAEMSAIELRDEADRLRVENAALRAEAAKLREDAKTFDARVRGELSKMGIHPLPPAFGAARGIHPIRVPAGKT